jgi:hypothetical protein
MISTCANPSCSTPLRYLRDGRIYQFEVRSCSTSSTGTKDPAGKKAVRQVCHFWLCGECSSQLTLVLDQLTGVKVIPLQQAFTLPQLEPDSAHVVA